MRIYNPLSQQEEDRIDGRLLEAVDMQEIVPANKHAIERIIFGRVGNTRLSSAICIYGSF